jgi:exodeoxyribonuclease VII small subunit
MNSNKKTAKHEDEQPFEAILEQIEDIVKALESSELPLDEALKKFEKGVKLSRAGAARLDAAERRIDEILQDGTTVPVKNVQ